VKGENIYLHFKLDQLYHQHNVKIITTGVLGKTKISKAFFENPDGTSLFLDEDYFGNVRSSENIKAGPFTNLNTGVIELKVW
jgi:hypothetical protein